MQSYSKLIMPVSMVVACSLRLQKMGVSQYQRQPRSHFKNWPGGTCEAWWLEPIGKAFDACWEHWVQAYEPAPLFKASYGTPPQHHSPPQLEQSLIAPLTRPPQWAILNGQFSMENPQWTIVNRYVLNRGAGAQLQVFLIHHSCDFFLLVLSSSHKIFFSPHTNCSFSSLWQ